MSQKDTTQMQNDPAAWKKVVAEQLNQAFRAIDELAKLQAKGVEDAQRAIDESARIMHESLGYFAQVSNEWRNVAVATTRRVAETVAPRA